MKIRIIIFGLILLCFGLSQIEDVSKAAQKALQEQESIMDVSRSASVIEGLQPEAVKFKSGRTGLETTNSW